MFNNDIPSYVVDNLALGPPLRRWNPQGSDAYFAKDDQLLKFDVIS